MIPSRNSKAVGLFSGSLDSILAFKLVTEQHIAAVALNFRLPFSIVGRTPNEEQLQRTADLLGVNLVSVNVDDDYLEIVRAPKYNYTINMAPCIDCMAYMLKRAKELMTEIKADFVFTGEVLGQRPFSQNKRSLKLLEKIVGLEGRLLRPLSAKILEPTLPELSGLVRRERLLDFHGRTRRRQIRLAREFGIVDYPPPGAGCLLTDINFAARCRDAILHNQLNNFQDVELLRYGRHFRLPSKARVIVGRNENENRVLEKFDLTNAMILKPVDTVGPVAILHSLKKTKKDMELAAKICAFYSDHSSGKPVKVACEQSMFSVKPCKTEEMLDWRITADLKYPLAPREVNNEHRNKNQNKTTD